MVKAVNKLILEINNTENEYFEKAVFYIRPEVSEQSKLRQSAEFYIEKVSGDCAFERKKKNTFIIGTAAAVVSALATALLFILLL